ncbi:hypothetical protein WJT86_05610 [Microvirga sp. W0021]|uniref:Major facilitator superfamily (MFS) profile domain-containing protein n=1 Tax=Hohaiivirga grylli TaxID=3133970 RepID=A0ABV0BI01_9HYPH
MPLVVEGVTGWSPKQVGLFATVPMGMALLATIFIGNSASKRKESRLHVGIPLVAAAIGFLMWASASNTTVVIIAVMLVAIGTYAPMGTWWTIPTTFLSGAAAAAGATGLINSVGNIGGWIGPYAIGWVKDASGGADGALYALAISLLISAIMVFCLGKIHPDTK